MYLLQSRYKIENKSLRYYGLRNKDKMFKNIRINNGLDMIETSYLFLLHFIFNV